MGSLIEMCCNAAADAPLPLFRSLVANLEHHGGLNTGRKEDVQAIASGVNRLLGQARSRLRGLMLLKGALESGSIHQDLITSHAHVWLPLCMKSLRPAEVPVREKRVAFSVISQLVERSSKIHELDRTTITSTIPDLIDNIERAVPALHFSALLCLESLLLGYILFALYKAEYIHFSKSCGNCKSQIEKFLVRFLDYQDENCVIYAAKCCHLLQQVRGGGEHGVNHKSAWKNQLTLLTCMANSLIKEIYSVSMETQTYENMSYFVANDPQSDIIGSNHNYENTPFYIVMKNVCVDVPLSDFLSKRRLNNAVNEEDDDDDNENQNDGMSLANKRMSHIGRIFARLRNTLTFIQAMLVEPFPVAKSIKTTAILELVIRCLGLKCKLPEQKQTLEAVMVSSQVPALYVQIMKTLEALIICLGTNILPNVMRIFRMLMQTLAVTKSENHSNGARPFKNVRIAVYDTMGLLFSVISTFKPPPQERENSFEDKLLKNIIDDISYFKQSLQLMIKDTGSVRNMSKKARNKLVMNQLASSNLSQKKNETANSESENPSILNADLINAALLCLEAFFKASGMFLKQDSHRLVQETILKQIYSKSTEKSLKESLLKALSAIQSYQSNRQPSVLSYSLNAFSRSQNSSNIELKLFSRDALHNCISSIRGCIPPIDLPMARPSDLNDRALCLENVVKSNIQSTNEIIDLENGSHDGENRSIPVQSKRKSEVMSNNSDSKKVRKDPAAPLEILDSSSDDDCRILEPSTINTILEENMSKKSTEKENAKESKSCDSIDTGNWPRTDVEEQEIVFEESMVHIENDLGLENKNHKDCSSNITNDDNEIARIAEMLKETEVENSSSVTNDGHSGQIDENEKISENSNIVTNEQEGVMAVQTVDEVTKTAVDNNENVNSKNVDANVEDMLSSFVDEVNDNFN